MTESHSTIPLAELTTTKGGIYLIEKTVEIQTNFRYC